MRTPIVTDPGIICFQHCGPKIFTMQLPERCPGCECDLGVTAPFKLMPFRLPYPFIKPYQHPCSIILRPTNGDFLNDYFNTMDLHIGLTSSKGVIYEFDRYGLRKTLAKKTDSAALQWAQSLLVETVPESWHEHWDNTLKELDKCQEKDWTATTYLEDSYNCYTFVLKFLQLLGYGTLSKMAQNRTEFCEQYIIPRTTAAGKYISLFRKIRDNGFFIYTDVKQSTIQPKISEKIILKPIKE